jgi:hypothetical protein
MKQLIKTTDTYRVDTEEEAIDMIQKTKDDQLTGGFTLTKSNYALKTKKSKGEVIDSWAIVSLEKSFE